MNTSGGPQLADGEVRGWLDVALLGEPPVPDAVPAVRSAIRRRRRTMAASTGLAFVAFVGLILGGLQLPRADNDRLDTVSPASVSPAPSISPSPSTAPSAKPPVTPSLPVVRPSPPVAAKPHLTVTITRTSPAGARDLTFSVRIRGRVPQLWNAQTGQPIPNGDPLLGTAVDFGDGSPPNGSDGGAVTCHRGAPLVTVDDTFPSGFWPHRYANPGNYALTFTARACGITVTRTAPVHVSAPAQLLSLALTTAPLVATVGQPVKVTLHTTGFAVDVWPYVVHYGDGARWVPASVGSHCADPPKPIDDTFTVEHTYTAPGDYTITASDGQCGPVGRATMSIHVDPAPSHGIVIRQPRFWVRDHIRG